MSLVNGNEQIRGESHPQLLMRLMKELLRDEQEHSLMEMKQTIMQQTGEEYSHGTWAGAVRRLTETWNGCRAVRRGVYQYLPPAVLQEAEDTAAQLKREAAAVLLRAQEQLTKLADRVNIVEAEESELKMALCLRETCQRLREETSRYEERGCHEEGDMG